MILSINPKKKTLPQEIVEQIQNLKLYHMGKRTKFEKKFQEDFFENIKMPLPYIVQQPCYFREGRICFLDFYVPSLRLAIEVDGVAHEIFNYGKDKLRDEMLKKYLQINTVRVLNRDIVYNYHVVVENLWPHIPHYVKNLYNKKMMENYVS